MTYCFYAQTILFEAAYYVDEARLGPLHGHSFELCATIALDDGAHEVEALSNLTAALERVRAILDHALLNDLDGLSNPSLRAIARWAIGHLQPTLATLTEIRVNRTIGGQSCTVQVSKDN